MKITRGSRLDLVDIGILSAGQVFEWKRHIGMITGRIVLGVVTVVYLNDGTLDEISHNIKVRKMKATMRVDY